MEVFKDIVLKDGRMVGHLDLPESAKIAVEFDLEEEDSSPDQSDFAELVSSATIWVRGLGTGTISILKKEIARELTDAAYGESDYQPSDSDYTDLETSLKTVRLCFYPDNVVIMVFEAKKEYPDMEVYCQLDSPYQLEDISVVKKTDQGF
ncbi:hypothetical protein [Chitinophaga sp. OAE865]|uniref:hypothetical protein n=1 Tax=Chitinophaga sp. OAE865 TaxID=2817898 RepID=UPI001AEA1B04